MSSCELDNVRSLVTVLCLAIAVGDKAWGENERIIFARSSDLIRNTSYDEKSCSIYPVSLEMSKTALTSSARDLVNQYIGYLGVDSYDGGEHGGEHDG